MDEKRATPWKRRGMKSPGYETTPVETGWCACGGKPR